jgi:uncharacterized protein (TIGR02598 family)
MRFSNHRSAAFSLLELTFALGVAAFCLIAVFVLMPVGVQTNRSATSQSAGTNIIAAVVADLRATPITSDSSPQLATRFGTNKTLYFDSTGQFTTSLSTNSRYQVNITWFSSGRDGLRYADVKVTWPAAVTPATAAGSAEMFAAFDRN